MYLLNKGGVILKSLILCTTASDSICKIALDSLEMKKIRFKHCDKPVGPHGIRAYADTVITANSYNDSVSFFYGENIIESKEISIGPKPNDLLMHEHKVYVVCGESNSMVIYDLKEDKSIGEIATESWPHSIDVDLNKNLLFVSNLESDSITVISMDNYDIVETIHAPEYPTKVRISNDGKKIYICCSYLGKDRRGYIDILNIGNFQRIARVMVGYSPVDMIEDTENIYVSNFTDGTISVIDKATYKVEKVIYVGGMPKGILKYGSVLYVADYLKSKLILIEDDKIIKVIAIESEPNAMTLF